MRLWRLPPAMGVGVFPAAAVVDPGTPGDGTSQFKSKVLALQPRAYYRFAEASGTVMKDSSGAGRDGVYPDDQANYTTASLLGDPDDKALVYKTATQSGGRWPYVNSTPFDTSMDWTIGFIVKPTEKPTTSSDLNYVILQATTPNTAEGGPEIGMVGDDTHYYFRIMQSGVKQVIETSATFKKPYGTVAVGFLTYSKDNALVELWINGQKVGSGTSNYRTYSGALRIGWADFGSPSYRYPFIGTLDELSIFPAKLTDAQIQDLSTAAIPPVAPDPYYSNVVMLTHFDQNTPVDQKGHSFLERMGFVDAGQKFGNGAANAAVIGSWMTASSDDFKMGTGAWTVEFWVKPSALPPSNQGEFTLFGFLPQAARNQNNANLFVVVKTDGSIKAYAKEKEVSGGTNAILAANSWSHVAVVREDSAMYIFVDGVRAAYEFVTPQDYTNPAFFLGSYFDQSSWSPIAFDDLRITKGVARYVNPFTPPAAAFPNAGPAPATDPYYSQVAALLRMDDANFIDQKGHTVTSDAGQFPAQGDGKFGKAAVFDGVDDYLLIMPSDDFLTDSKPYTIEMWVKTTQAPEGSYSKRIFAPGQTTNVYPSQLLMSATGFYNTPGEIAWDVLGQGDTTVFLRSKAALNDGVWHHLACTLDITQDNNGYLFSYRFFVDGVLQDSRQAIGGSNPVEPYRARFESQGIRLGGRSDKSPGSFFAGAIDDFRLTVGVARYTKDFTPPTAPHPNA